MESKDLFTVCGGIIIAWISYVAGKSKDKADARNKLKIEYYKEFVQAQSLIIPPSPNSQRVITSQDHQRFADVGNSMIIVASPKVSKLLQEYRDEISFSNKANSTPESKDIKFTRLIKAMREEIGVSNKGLDKDFKFYLFSGD